MTWKILAVFFVFMASAVFLIGCSWKRPANLGVADGKLRECPSSPNCVSSQSSRETSRVGSIAFRDSPEETRNKLLSVLEGMPRAKVITRDVSYIHAEFTSALFRFVDDVEFLFDDTARVIHVRSASRVGHSDLGANRKRVESIREHFTGK